MADTSAPETDKKPRIGIISMGDMGSGLARLLVAHGYHVATNCTGRSQDTTSRAIAAGVQILPTDRDLTTQCDLILSVVPPKDALQTAERILSAISSPDNQRPKKPLYFADMNAISPATVRTIASLFSAIPSSTLRFIDGSILGGPPSPPPKSSSSSQTPEDTKKAEAEAKEWARPLLPTSGPYSFSSLDLSNALSQLLNSNHISQDIGSASGLKMCFASLSKGYTAIAVQTITTAYRLGVLDALKDSLRQLSPPNLERMERAVVGMAPKAYRWVREMQEISAAHAVDGGFLVSSAAEDGGEETTTESIFDGAAGIFQFVAEGTVLGEEKVPIVELEAGEEGTGSSRSSNSKKRVRGTTSEDVARCMAEGLEKRENKKRKN